MKFRYNKDVVWHEIDENDPKVYDVIRSGDTVGMFQIECKTVFKMIVFCI
ncbi:MAG: hypothetical protein AB7G20_02035 [Sulfurimonas sp.]